MISSLSRLLRIRAETFFRISVVVSGLALPIHAANWPAWRGPDGQGISFETNLPTKWSATENVKWRASLPEPGNSTPIVWDDRIFVTQAVGMQRTLMCFDRKDGKMLWLKGVKATQKDPTHNTNPYCSASPVTDGERVIASFASEGLFCYDFDGKELWKRTDLGRQIHIWGGATSPVIYGDMCLLNFGPGETTYLLAVNKRTGATIWKKDEETGYGKPATADVRKSASSKGAGPMATDIGSWSTPVLMKVDGEDEILMSWPRRVAAYEPTSGKELWSCAGLNPLVYSSPIYSDGIVVAMGGYGGSAIGFRPGGSGDITATHRLWQHPKTPQRIGSGVIYQGHIYIHNDPSTAQCFDLKTGAMVWQERMQTIGATGENWSSIMLSGDNCYTITQGGDCFVFKANPKFQLVSLNSLKERSNSSIVPSNGNCSFGRTKRFGALVKNKKV
jgi:outer membrane protein assembly factor BamB